MAVASLAVLLAPGLWWRAGIASNLTAVGLTAQPLAIGAGVLDEGPIGLLGAWELESAEPRFGSYSALLALSSGRLLAFSDTGNFAEFGDPGVALAPVRIARLNDTDEVRKTRRDIESATMDRASGRIWLAYESTNVIRSAAALEGEWAAVQPEAMQDWHFNEGAEAMVRLFDGRFVILREKPSGGAKGSPGLLFAEDPLEGGTPVEFRFTPPEDFRPTDMAVLPDGRVLILLRAVQAPLLPFFRTMLVLADPDAISPGEDWEWRMVAELPEGLPQDNYEALAIVPGSRDRVTLWLISDDNDSIFQRTLLLKLAWNVPPR